LESRRVDGIVIRGYNYRLYLFLPIFAAAIAGRQGDTFLGVLYL